MKKVKFKINGMHCSSCALNIDGRLEETAGIKEANTSYARQETTVIFAEDKMSEEGILKFIKEIGYSAFKFKEEGG